MFTPVAFFAGLCFVSTAFSSDWPMWRYDAGRGGATPHALPAGLELHWTRDLGPPQPAWPRQVDDFEKLEFDASYEPTVAGGLIYVASMSADRVAAYDVETGEEQWRYYANGPVRLPPAVWNGRLYFVSDDGCLYCLDAADGAELWRFNAAPSPRAALGNLRLISVWPCRGGPVVTDGEVYFAAGIWPFEGVFVYALDAETGAVKWVNSGTGAYFNLHQHPGSYAYGGPAPQGCLAVSGDRLLVPGGRTPPAVFDRRTGEFLHFHQSHDMIGGAAGGHRVYARGDWYVNARDRTAAHLYHLETGAQHGAYNIQVVSERAFFGLEPVTVTNALLQPLESALADMPLPEESGEFREISAGPEVIRARVLEHRYTQWLPFAYSVELLDTGAKSGGTAPRAAVRERYKLQMLWDMRTGGASANLGLERLHIKAGPVLYGSGAHGRILAIGLEPPDGPPEELKWTASVPGEVFSMLAASDRLFVVTRQGTLYCFGPGKRGVRTHVRELKPLPAAQSEVAPALLAEAQRCGEDYAVLFGLGDGSALGALLARTSMRVVAVESDSEKAERWRRRLDEAGLYGLRASVICAEPFGFSFPPYLAAVAVAEELPEAFDKTEAARKIFSVLRPYGGKAFVRASDSAARAAFGVAAETAGLENAQIAAADEYVVLTRAGSLPGAGQWTHHYANAGNTAYSSDRLVKAPLGVLWFGNNSNEKALPRHMGGPIPEVVQGRLVVLGVNHISARCVYTGRELWARELPLVGENFTSLEDECRLPAFFPLHPGSAFIGSPFVCATDSVYVIHEDKCLRLALDTGETLAAFVLPPAEHLAELARKWDGVEDIKTDETVNKPWGYVSVWEDMLIACAYPHYFDYAQPGRAGNWNSTSSEFLVGMDRRTGEVRWARHARYGFRHNAVATGAGRTFFADNLSKTVLDALARRGFASDAKPYITALDARTGETLWTYEKAVFGTWLAYSEEHDILIQAGRPGGAWNPLRDEPGGRIIALRGKDGQELWQKTFSYTGPVIVHEGLKRIIESRAGASIGLLDGAPVSRINPLSGLQEPWQMSRHYGCGTMMASEHLLTFRSGAAGYYDLDGESGTVNLGGFRAGCTVNMIAADGVMNAPDYTRTCTCSYQNQTSLGLIHAPDVEMWTHNTFSNAPAGGLKRVGVNFGAAGSRVAENRILWVDYPRVGGRTPDVAVSVAPTNDLRFLRHHSSFVEAGGASYPWVAASGVEGMLAVRIDGLLPAESAAGATSKYTVRLHFAELGPVAAGERVFDILAQGGVAAEDFDIAAAAGGVRKAAVVECKGLVPFEGKAPESGALEIEFDPAATSRFPPLICGLEALLEE